MPQEVAKLPFKNYELLGKVVNIFLPQFQQILIAVLSEVSETFKGILLIILFENECFTMRNWQHSKAHTTFFFSTAVCLHCRKRNRNLDSPLFLFLHFGQIAFKLGSRFPSSTRDCMFVRGWASRTKFYTRDKGSKRAFFMPPFIALIKTILKKIALNDHKMFDTFSSSFCSLVAISFRPEMPTFRLLLFRPSIPSFMLFPQLQGSYFKHIPPFATLRIYSHVLISQM